MTLKTIFWLNINKVTVLGLYMLTANHMIILRPWASILVHFIPNHGMLYISPMSYCDKEIRQTGHNYINIDLTKKLRPLYFLQLLKLQKIKWCPFIDLYDIYLDMADFTICCILCHTMTQSRKFDKLAITSLILI